MLFDLILVCLTTLGFTFFLSSIVRDMKKELEKYNKEDKKDAR